MLAVEWAAWPHRLGTSSLGNSHNGRMQPTVSVVIPVRNEAKRIGTTLQSVLAQSYANITEIIIADGQSTDETRERITEIDDDRITVLDNPATTTPAALNIASRRATGDVIVRCDGHCVLPPDYVTNAIATMQSENAVNVGGIQRAVGTGVVQSSIALAMSSKLGVGDAKFHYGGEPGPTDTVFLGVFDRAALLEAGLFDESLIRNQDYELNIRLRQGGGLVYFDPRLSVDYFPRDTYRTLAKQYFQYGAWKRIVHRRHPDSIKLRQLAPPALIIGLVVSGLLLLASQLLLGAIIPIAYLAALVAATAVALARSRAAAAILMPLAILTMHVSWGAGYLSGKRPGTPASSA